MERIKVQEGDYYDVSDLSDAALRRLTTAISVERDLRSKARMKLPVDDFLQFDMYYDVLEATINIVDKYRRMSQEEE